MERGGLTCSAGELVDDEPADETTEETHECGDRDGHGGLAKGHAAHEDDGFKACERVMY